MRRSVYIGERLRRGGFGQAKDFACPLVIPVADETDAVTGLDGQVLLVCAAVTASGVSPSTLWWISMNSGMCLTVTCRIESFLAPAWLFIQADAKRGLAHDLMCEHRVRRVEPTGAHVSVQPFELAALEHA